MAAVAAFIIAAVMGIWLVPFLKKIHFGQTIRDEGPSVFMLEGWNFMFIRVP